MVKGSPNKTGSFKFQRSVGDRLNIGTPRLEVQFAEFNLLNSYVFHCYFYSIQLSNAVVKIHDYANSRVNQAVQNKILGCKSYTNAADLVR